MLEVAIVVGVGNDTENDGVAVEYCDDTEKDDAEEEVVPLLLAAYCEDTTKDVEVGCEAVGTLVLEGVRTAEVVEVDNEGENDVAAYCDDTAKEEAAV